MKSSARTTMYASAADEVRSCFADYLVGTENATVAILSSSPLPPEAKNALTKSASARGYGENACVFVVSSGCSSEASGMPPLDANAVFMLIEGIDPLVIIASDSNAAQLLATAYRASVPFERPFHLFGRPALAFRDFAALLSSPDRKAFAWSKLKQTL